MRSDPGCTRGSHTIDEVRDSVIMSCETYALVGSVLISRVGFDAWHQLLTSTSNHRALLMSISIPMIVDPTVAIQSNHRHNNAKPGQSQMGGGSATLGIDDDDTADYVVLFYGIFASLASVGSALIVMNAISLIIQVYVRN